MRRFLTRLVLVLACIACGPGSSATVMAAEAGRIGGRFRVTADDPDVASGLYDLLEQAGRDFDLLLPTTNRWLSPIEVAVTGPSADGSEETTRRVVLRDDRLVFQLDVPAPPAVTVERLMPPVGELLVYELSTRTRRELGVGQELPRPPSWLVRGVAAQLTRSRHREFAQVVHHLVPRRRVPTIVQMQGWSNDAPTRLEQDWRDAFSYWAVRQVGRDVAQRRALAAWISGLGAAPAGVPAAYWPATNQAQAWWEATLNRSIREPVEPILGLEETQTDLYRILPTALSGTNGTRRLVAFPQLGDEPLTAELREALLRKADELTRLLSRGDAMYRSVPAAYLRAVNALLAGSAEQRAQFANLARMAGETLDEVNRTRGGIIDFVNWVQVTETTARPDETFESFFNTKRVLEAAERVRPRQTPPPLTIRK